MSGNDKSGIYARLTTAGKVVAVVLAIFVGTRIVGILGNCSVPGCGVTGDSFDDKMSVLRKTDQKLVLFKEAKRIPTRFKESRGIALGSDGRLYVAGDKAVIIYGKNFSRQGGFRLNYEPYCIAASPDGTVYVGMRDHIETFDAKVKAIARWSSLGKNAYITSISVGKSEIWVANAGNRSILKYNQTGQVTAVFGKKDKSRGVPGIVVPSPHLDVAAVSGGSVWATNPGRHEVELYNTDGSLKRFWGKASFATEGFSGCCNPTDIAVMPDGRFITSEKGLPRVKIYNNKGKFQGIVAGFETFAPNVVGLDLAVDSNGRVFVLDTATNNVRVYVPKAKVKS